VARFPRFWTAHRSWCGAPKWFGIAGLARDQAGGNAARTCFTFSINANVPILKRRSQFAGLKDKRRPARSAESLALRLDKCFAHEPSAGMQRIAYPGPE